MKVLIIGYGVVGKAQAHLCESLGHEVSIYDPYLKEYNLINEPDLSFICIPESNLEDSFDFLVSKKIVGLYVIKSTVEMGSTNKLMEKHKIHICHNPEFLREKYPFKDVLNPSRVIIGECCTAHGNILENFYKPLTSNIYRVDPESSELAKLTSNSYLATLITFWNEIFRLTTATELDIKTVAKLVCADPRMSRYGTSKFGEGYDGSCLPKDVRHLMNAFLMKTDDAELFLSIDRINNKLLKLDA